MPDETKIEPEQKPKIDRHDPAFVAAAVRGKKAAAARRARERAADQAVADARELQERVSERYHGGLYLPSEIGKLTQFFEIGIDLLRDLGYRKRSFDGLEQEEIEQIQEKEDPLPYEEKKYTKFLYVDSMATDFVYQARHIQLTTELIQFEIKVLESVIEWATQHPDKFEHRDKIEIEKELEARKSGIDTFEPPAPVKVRQKPGPKPGSHHQSKPTIEIVDVVALRSLTAADQVVDQ